MEELSIANDMADDLEDDMATTSIMHNFVFRGPEVAERFAKILEESANDPPRPVSNKFRCLQDPEEIRECMEKLERAYSQRSVAESRSASFKRLQALEARTDGEEE